MNQIVEFQQFWEIKHTKICELILWENMLYSGEIYTACKKITLLPRVTLGTNQLDMISDMNIADLQDWSVARI